MSRNLIDIFFNPANVGNVKTNKTKDEILRLYNDSGERIQFPRVADKKITPEPTFNKNTRQKVNYEPVLLNGQQRAEFQKQLGIETMKSFKEKMADDKYKKLSDGEKARLLQTAITNARKATEKKIIKELKLPLKPKGSK
jgi:hypothetical protein